MGTFRRIVTGHSADGKSVIASDRLVEFNQIPGWAVSYSARCGARTLRPSIPTRAGSRRITPGSRRSAACGSPSSCCRRTAPRTIPDLGRSAGPGRRGEARSRTDVAFRRPESRHAPLGDDGHAVRDLRRCVLELDDGSKTEIGAGDVVVQSGTMHRWHNPFAEPCRVLGALVGARWTK